MKNLLTIKQNSLGSQHFTVLLFLAFIFSVAVRYIWVYQFGGNDNMSWNNQLMINTNDGYFFAEGARDLIAGGHQPNDLSPVHLPLAQLTAFLASILPFSSFKSLLR